MDDDKQRRHVGALEYRIVANRSRATQGRLRRGVVWYHWQALWLAAGNPNADMDDDNDYRNGKGDHSMDNVDDLDKLELRRRPIELQKVVVSREGGVVL